MQLLDIGVPWHIAIDMSHSDRTAYTMAARRLAVRKRLDTYQAVMLTRCDPEKHQAIVDDWLDETSTLHQHEQRHGTPGQGYSLAEYMQLLSGGGN